MTSHAAVVARGMGKPCVAGCEELSIDVDARTIARSAATSCARATCSRSTAGPARVIVGEVAARAAAGQRGPRDDPRLGATSMRRLGCARTRTRPQDAAKAREFGAEGIGLCRTEHMFMAEERLPVVREMILADDEDGRREALDRLLPMQQGDFEGIFEAMAGLPVTIRLLDPPLHEFLPPLEEATDERMRAADQAAAGGEPDARHARLPARPAVAGDLRDAGARDRARRARRRTSGPARRRSSRSCIRSSASPRSSSGCASSRCASPRRRRPRSSTSCGTMIELPRACIRADEIAEHADFFSFGTNDLTQTALGFSRDDAEGKFLDALPRGRRPRARTRSRRSTRAASAT